MRYQGGKSKLAKDILRVIQPHRGTRILVEPFAGAMNITVTAGGERWANDADPRLIALFTALREGWEPPDTISEELYYDVKRNPANHHPAMQAFVGCGCSFGGKWWGGWSAPSKCGRNYAAEAKRGLARKMALLEGVRFSCTGYDQMELPPPDQCVVYCDPPYGDTTGYDGAKFDSVAFWAWCERKRIEGYPIFVSEYSCAVEPEWPVVWEKPWKTSLSGSWDIKERVERLYHLAPGANRCPAS